MHTTNKRNRNATRPIFAKIVILKPSVDRRKSSPSLVDKALSHYEPEFDSSFLNSMIINCGIKDGHPAKIVYTLQKKLPFTCGHVQAINAAKMHDKRRVFFYRHENSREN